MLRTIPLLVIAGCQSAAGRSSSAPAPANMPPAIPATGVIGVNAAQLDPGFWVQRQARGSEVILGASAVAAQNAAMLERDRSLYDLDRMPATLGRAQVAQWVTRLTPAPGRRLWDERGDSVTAAEFAALLAAVQTEAVPAEQPARYALVVRRANMRTLPTRRRVFSTTGGTDIDRWQETDVFPGDAVVLVHESRDGQWWFAVGRHYAAWLEKSAVAEGPREDVLGYGRRTPFLVVTGAKEFTVFTPEQPGVSELQLDMGVRVPLLADWPADQLVNGQHPYASRVIQLPVRGADGRLALVPALLSNRADVATDYLPLTPANILRQSFKFLGERYGWGHSYNGRDCSGFVSEVYRSMGVDLPRNTSDQAVTPVLNRLAFTQGDSREARMALLRQAEVGDLIFIPGHVVMVIGHLNGTPYVIHDVTGISYRNAEGAIVRVPLNQVSVTPFFPLSAGGDALWVDRITSVQRMRPARSAAR